MADTTKIKRVQKVNIIGPDGSKKDTNVYLAPDASKVLVNPTDSSGNKASLQDFLLAKFIIEEIDKVDPKTGNKIYDANGKAVKETIKVRATTIQTDEQGAEIEVNDYYEIDPSSTSMMQEWNDYQECLKRRLVGIYDENGNYTGYDFLKIDGEEQPSQHQLDKIIEVYDLEDKLAEYIKLGKIPQTTSLNDFAKSFLLSLNGKSVYQHIRDLESFNVELPIEDYENAESGTAIATRSEIADIHITNDIVGSFVLDINTVPVNNYNCCVISSLSSRLFKEKEANIPINATYKEQHYQRVGFIAPEAFKNNAYIQSLTTWHGLYSIGNGAFENCPHLKTIELADTLQPIESTDYNYGIGRRAFANCSKLKEITFKPVGPNQEAKLTIDDKAFENCGSIENVVIPNHVKELGYGLFGNCPNIKELTLPFVGTQLSSPFSQTHGLGYVLSGDVVEIKGEVPQAARYEIDWQPGTDKPALIWKVGQNTLFMPVEIYTNQEKNRIELVNKNAATGEIEHTFVPAVDGVKMIVQMDWYGENDYRDVPRIIPKGLKKVTILGGTLHNSSFKNCDMIEEIVLEKDVTTIYNNCFNNCTGLKFLRIKNPDIIFSSGGQQIFWNCSNFTIHFAGTKEQWNTARVKIGENNTGGNKFVYQGSGDSQDYNFPGVEVVCIDGRIGINGEVLANDK